MVDFFRVGATALAGAAPVLGWSLYKANRRAAKWRSRAFESAQAASLWEDRAWSVLRSMEKVKNHMADMADSLQGQVFGEVNMEASATGFVATMILNGESRRISYEYGSDQFFVVGQDANEELDLNECEPHVRLMLDFARSSYLNVRNEKEG